ncbi:MAG: hypothetical protein U9N04_01165 [Patescibacteria group bacterium]|nr:hypothetical protein [Patescibacteria group bacterium]
MKELVKQVYNIRDICKEYDKKLKEVLKIKNSVKDSRIDCFAMIFNQATLAFELLDFYYGRWNNPPIKENEERCMAISKMLFIASISSIEFSVKKSILLYPKSELCKFYLEKQKNDKFVSFYEIITRKSKHFITEEDKQSWEFLITIRNATVHNNSISDKSREIKINGRKLRIKKDEMMQGKLDHYIFLTIEAIKRYYYWTKEFDKNCN